MAHGFESLGRLLVRIRVADKGHKQISASTEAFGAGSDGTPSTAQALQCLRMPSHARLLDVAGEETAARIAAAGPGESEDPALGEAR